MRTLLLTVSIFLIFAVQSNAEEGFYLQGLGDRTYFNNNTGEPYWSLDKSDIMIPIESIAQFNG